MKPPKVDEHAPKSLPARTDSEAVGYGRPPKEHQFKKEDGGGGQDQGQDQGQQKQAAVAAYQNLRSLVIRTAAANPEARQAFLPLLQALKNG